MPRARFRLFFAILAGFFALAPAARAGDKVILIGDSWAALTGYTGLWNQIFAANGHPELTVETSAFNGGLARDYADDPGLVPGLLAANPDAEWVLISLGGNDLMTDYSNHNQNGWETRLANAYRAIVNPIIDARPSIRILLYGYDFGNWVMSPECQALAVLTFPDLFGSTPFINLEFLNLGGVQADVAAQFSNVKQVEVWGTLQAAGGVPGAPDIQQPSPPQYMTDCIHLNEAGYTLFLQAVWDAFFPAALACATDADGDGYLDEACGGVDCNDANAAVNPGVPEILGNGINDDCNATTGDAAPPGGCAPVAASGGVGAGGAAFAMLSAVGLAGAARGSRRRLP